jgi:hypothetical protein
MLKKIISGGQTGIDRMGLEVARDLGLETGGTAPIGFMTENGPDLKLRDVFGLREITPEENEQYIYLFNRNLKDRYTGRTCTNVRESNGTVIFASNKNSSGTKLTKDVCEYYMHPYVINPNIDRLKKFITENNIEVLNVAGNRGSRLKDRDAVSFRIILSETIKQLRNEQK